MAYAPLCHQNNSLSFAEFSCLMTAETAAVQIAEAEQVKKRLRRRNSLLRASSSFQEDEEEKAADTAHAKRIIKEHEEEVQASRIMLEKARCVPYDDSSCSCFCSC